jgi:hypothetical protein
MITQADLQERIPFVKDLGVALLLAQPEAREST